MRLRLPFIVMGRSRYEERLQDGVRTGYSAGYAAAEDVSRGKRQPSRFREPAIPKPKRAKS